MELLLTILSALAVWIFLTVLVIGLFLIFKLLDGVRRHLEQITMGVRAIEVETQPLGPRAERLGREATNAALALGGMVEAIERVEQRLDVLELRLRSS